MNESHWRIAARETIERVIASQTTRLTVPELKKVLSAAYPFGTRKHFPYKIWLSEVRRAVGETQKPRASELERLKQWNEDAKVWGK